MRILTHLLFPARTLFLRLHLYRQWWHRLAVVLFFLSLAGTFLCTWFLSAEAHAVTQPYMEEIKHWAPSIDGGWIDIEALPRSDSEGHPAKIPHIATKTVQMPDGKLGQFPGYVSDKIIAVEWGRQHAEVKRKALAAGFLMAAGTTLLASYLLQLAYRGALYLFLGAMFAPRKRVLLEGGER